MISPIVVGLILVIGGNVYLADAQDELCWGSGWKYWNGSCYKAVSHPASMVFPLARKICKALDADVVSIHSKAENEFIAGIYAPIHALLKNSPKGELPEEQECTNRKPFAWNDVIAGMWIGYRRRPIPGSKKYNCSWVDGSPVDYAGVPEAESAPSRSNGPKGPIAVGYPWTQYNPADRDVSLCPNSSKLDPTCMDTDLCVSMENWPNTPYNGTWQTLSCTKHRLSAVMCKKAAHACAAPVCPKTVPPKQPCNNGSFPSDTIVLLDGSNSITEANFHKYMLNFTKQVAKALNISQSGNRLGVVQFSTNQVLEIPLDKGNDLKSVEQRIDNIKYFNATTNMGSALAFVDSTALAQPPARPGVNKTVIVITDGRPTDDANAYKKPANDLRAHGVKMVAVGVGNAINKTQLEDMTGNKDNVFDVTTFDALTKELAEQVVCK